MIDYTVELLISHYCHHCGDDSILRTNDTRYSGCLFIKYTPSYFMDNACACGSPVIGWSTHARACT